MPRRRMPRFASLIFCLVVLLAVGALAWGADHGRSTGDSIGSAKDQAAARTTLQTGLHLPAGIVRDSTFTACGGVADACLTGNSTVAATLTTLTTVMHAAGGSVPGTCDMTFSKPAGSDELGFTCGVQGKLKGAEVVFLLGSEWSLPGHPTPKTAVKATVVTKPPAAPTKSPAAPTKSPATPGTAADAAALVPVAWSRAPQLCAGGSTPPASTPATSAAVSPPPSAPPLSSIETAPPLPACTPNAITVDIGVHLGLSTAAAQLAALALANGFRLDGHPCIAGATPTSCGVRGERISSGVEELFVTTLTDDGRGNTVGTLAVTKQS